MISKIVIFTDLDGTLLHNETFKFENIRQYIKNLLSKNISIIPNSSKTKAEIYNFCHELEEELPFIVENGAAIYKMNLVNSDFPEKIILSRDKDEILNVFFKKIPKELISKCRFVLKLKKDEQLRIFGLSEKQLNYASDREFSVPLIFKGNKAEKNNLFRLAYNLSLIHI